MKLQKIIDVIEKIAPPEFACEWDNIGLMIGLTDSDVNSAVLSLDFDENAVKTAVKCGAELIITHHPAIFKPIYNITDKLMIDVIKNDIAVYSAHTNFDSAINGVNYVLADRLEMYNCAQCGMMRVGRINETQLSGVIDVVKKNLNVSGLRYVGDLNKIIRKVAVLGGAGGDFIQEAFECGCDLLVTGECKYDQAQRADKLGIAVIAAGHFETEYPAITRLADLIKQRIDIEIIEAKPSNIFKTV